MLTPTPNLSAVLATSLDAVVVTDVKGVVVGWNKNAESMFGYTEAEAVHRQIAELIVPMETRAAHLHGMNRFVETGEVHILGQRVKLLASHKEGFEFPIELAVMITSAVGSKCFVAFIRDLRSELAAAQEIAQLQSRVLHLSRLNAIGTTASMLAHELNQPLAAAVNYLSGCSHLIKGAEGPQTAEIAEAIREAQSAMMRASMVVKTVREIVAKRSTLRTSVSLRELVESSVGFSGDRSITPVLDVPPGAEYIFVDPVQFEHVFQNILKNAADAVAGQSIKSIVCSAKRQGRMVEICIRDNGAGLSIEAEKDLFSPKISNKKKGLGIGLSICRTIVEEHGGKIWCESDSTGAAFFISIASD